MALLDLARTSVRVVTKLTDEEIEMWIAGAIAEMRRIGIREDLIDEESMSAPAKQAVVTYVKAHYGYDNEEADRFMASFHQMCVDLMNSTANVCAESPSSEGDGSDGEGSESGTCPCCDAGDLMTEADVDALVDGG